MKIALLEEKTVSTGDISTAGFDALGEVSRYPLTPQEKVIERTSGCDAVIINKTVFSDEVISACEGLRYIGLCATGYNNVDLASASRHGLVVTNVPAYSTNAVAEQVFAYIMHFAKRVNDFSGLVHDGGWIRSDTFSMFDFPTYELFGKTLGIVGLGSIGTAVARIGRAFGMRVLAAVHTAKTSDIAEITDIETVFSESDFVSLHCPLTPQTEKLVGMKLMSLCKPSAVLINTSRGPVVDIDDLASALKSGMIAGAALDVIPREPMEDGFPLLGLGNCIITPHTGWAPRETRERLLDIAVDNLRSFIGGNIKNNVNEV